MVAVFDLKANQKVEEIPTGMHLWQKDGGIIELNIFQLHPQKSRCSKHIILLWIFCFFSSRAKDVSLAWASSKFTQHSTSGELVDRGLVGRSFPKQVPKKNWEQSGNRRNPNIARGLGDSCPNYL